jgi:hypothetical protein
MQGDGLRNLSFSSFPGNYLEYIGGGAMFEFFLFFVSLLLYIKHWFNLSARKAPVAHFSLKQYR